MYTPPGITGAGDAGASGFLSGFTADSLLTQLGGFYTAKKQADAAEKIAEVQASALKAQAKADAKGEANAAAAGAAAAIAAAKAPKPKLGLYLGIGGALAAVALLVSSRGRRRG